jgi:hypothetical protein
LKLTVGFGIGVLGVETAALVGAIAPGSGTFGECPGLGTRLLDLGRRGRQRDSRQVSDASVEGRAETGSPC